MTEPDDARPDGVDLGKHPAPEEPFDPYRFGRPDHPVPAEYAPPGYTGPTTPSPPYASPGYPAPSDNPFGNPPGTPYGPYGPPPQDPYRYGVPPPPPYSGYQQPRTGNGKAVAALVLGILSIALFWLSVLDAFLIVPAVVFGIIGLTESARTGSGRGLAIAGLVCGVVGMVAATIFTVVIVHAANQCGGLDNNNAPGFQQCVRDHL